ncbi:MAG: S8 family peptidase [Parafilimonas sp.]
MQLLIKRVVVYCFTFCIVSLLHAQDMDKYSAKNWQLMDLTKDSVYGASVTKAYDELLAGKKSHTVIVAVIDAGIDTAHEDLKGHVWTNTKEIPGNGIDDDHNGYVDDVHGWNFLGGKNGRNIESESLEAYREYYRLHAVYGNITDSAQVAADKKEEYRYWLILQNSHTEDSVKASQTISGMQPLLSMLKNIDSIWQIQLHKDSVTVGDIKAALVSDSSASTTADSLGKIAVMFYERRNIPDDYPIEILLDGGMKYYETQQKTLQSFSIDPNAARRDIVGDDFDNINDKNYGNPNVDAGTPTHGTHVAGIIAATRNNNIGMDGVDDNVIIMPVRAVPDGDERDKDIALAIRYAVDNGAQIISMSFGKPYSPGKSWVDDAVKYAAKKDVLLVHAAGNDGKDIDTTNDYPSPDFLNNGGKATTYITVGASAGGPDSLLAASFSNYGSKEVDLFSPGVNVYSTIPGDKYAAFSGTSMATPVVSGVAALVLEYYPKLSAKQLKYVLENSVSTYPNDMVKEPGTGNDVEFSTLSKTGGIVNAYNALKLAATIKGERK